MKKSNKFENVFIGLYFIVSIIMLIISLFFTWLINDIVEELFLAFSVFCFALSNIYISKAKSSIDKVKYIILIIVGYIATMFTLMSEFTYGSIELDNNLWYNALDYEDSYLIIASIVSIVICIASIIFCRNEKVVKICKIISKAIGIITFICVAGYLIALCVCGFTK